METIQPRKIFETYGLASEPVMANSVRLMRGKIESKRTVSEESLGIYLMENSFGYRRIFRISNQGKFIQKTGETGLISMLPPLILKTFEFSYQFNGGFRISQTVDEWIEELIKREEQQILEYIGKFVEGYKLIRIFNKIETKNQVKKELKQVYRVVSNEIYNSKLTSQISNELIQQVEIQRVK